MIILVPKKSFKKKIEKWVVHKDFLIVDATDSHSGDMRQYGNVMDGDELAATPTLSKIAVDPDSQESKIKRRNLQAYIDRWLTDEGINIKIHAIVRAIVKGYSSNDEDTNVFVVMRNELYYAYGKYVMDYINETYGVSVAAMVTHKMEKPEVKAILTKKFDREHYKTLKKSLKRVAKTYDINPGEYALLQGMDD